MTGFYAIPINEISHFIETPLKKANIFVVEITFKGIKSSIGVTKYKLQEELPNYLAKRSSE